MRQLRLVGVADDGASLLLETPTGDAFRLPLDERVRAACRGDLTRLGQIEIEMDNPLRPREIQARVRAGESAEEVAASSGMPLDRVLRFASPMLQERERVVAQARTARVRRQAPGDAGPAGRGAAGRPRHRRGHAALGRLAARGREVDRPAELAARRRALGQLGLPAGHPHAAAGRPGRRAAERGGVPRTDDHGGDAAGGRGAGVRTAGWRLRAPGRHGPPVPGRPAGPRGRGAGRPLPRHPLRCRRRPADVPRAGDRSGRSGERSRAGGRREHGRHRPGRPARAAVRAAPARVEAEPA